MDTKTEDQMGSYVLSAMTGTLMGRGMDADEVTDRIVDNGWAEPTDETRSQVTEKLEDLRSQGWIDRSGDKFVLSGKFTAQIFGDEG